MWRVVHFRPGGNPIRALAQALACEGSLYSSYEGEDATELVNLLLEATAHPEPIYVVLTMRSDFLGDCSVFHGLPEAINEGQYLVPRLTRDERRAAIAGPIAVAGAQIDPALLTRLVNDVGDNPDQLSILQHALNRTWARWKARAPDGRPLSLEDYAAIGTMSEALDRHAEKAFAELGDERQRRICEKLFKALTDQGTNARGVRRPTTVERLCAMTGAPPAELAAVIDVYRRPSRQAFSGRVARLSDPDALRMAVQAYYSYRAENPGKVRKPYLYFVDYGLNSRTPRGYVFDMDALEVVDGPFTVAHGRGSVAGGKDVPTRFSNRHGSNATSLGLYLAQEIYAFRGKSGGKAYRSPGLRLEGVSGKYNSAARARGVVVHGAPYVTASRAGRSEGCPAVEMDRAEKLIPQIANGGMVFLFSPLDRTWKTEDRWASLGAPGRAKG